MYIDTKYDIDLSNERNNFTTFLHKYYILALYNHTKHTQWCAFACVFELFSNVPFEMQILRLKISAISINSIPIHLYFPGFLCAALQIAMESNKKAIERINKIKWTQSKGILNWWKETITANNSSECVHT